MNTHAVTEVTVTFYLTADLGTDRGDLTESFVSWLDHKIPGDQHGAAMVGEEAVPFYLDHWYRPRFERVRALFEQKQPPFDVGTADRWAVVPGGAYDNEEDMMRADQYPEEG